MGKIFLDKEVILPRISPRARGAVISGIELGACGICFTFYTKGLDDLVYDGSGSNIFQAPCLCVPTSLSFPAWVGKHF